MVSIGWKAKEEPINLNITHENEIIDCNWIHSRPYDYPYLANLFVNLRFINRQIYGLNSGIVKCVILVNRCLGIHLWNAYTSALISPPLSPSIHRYTLIGCLELTHLYINPGVIFSYLILLKKKLKPTMLNGSKPTSSLIDLEGVKFSDVCRYCDDTISPKATWCKFFI